VTDGTAPHAVNFSIAGDPYPLHTSLVKLLFWQFIILLDFSRYRISLKDD